MVYFEVVQHLTRIREIITKAAEPLDGVLADPMPEPEEDDSFDHQMLGALARIREQAIEAEILALKLSTECAYQERRRLTGLAPHVPSDPD